MLVIQLLGNKKKDQRKYEYLWLQPGIPGGVLLLSLYLLGATAGLLTDMNILQSLNTPDLRGDRAAWWGN